MSIIADGCGTVKRLTEIPVDMLYNLLGKMAANFGEKRMASMIAR